MRKVGFASTRRRAASAVLTVVMAAALTFISEPITSSTALDGSTFDPGNIVSDEVFFNSRMSQAEIQTFLNAKGSFLASYSQDTPTRTWSWGTCGTYQGANGESAAQIIFKVQNACGLSAQAILVTLQKEQGLITNSSGAGLYKAMGFACPDSATCDSTFYGFFNQVFAAARQLTWYGNPSGSFTYIALGAYNSIRYSPDASCGSKSVFVQNRATAALYYYTPYTPNTAAMANLYGVGDSCSAYGNRNFWRYFNDWFGTAANPKFNIESVTSTDGVIRVQGWALDPDSTQSLQVNVALNGRGAPYGTAILRGDVNTAFHTSGNHGFDISLPADGLGNQHVCLTFVNIGPGKNVEAPCSDVSPNFTSPIGLIESSQIQSGQVHLTGWTLDPDLPTNSLQVNVAINGNGFPFGSNIMRPDVNTAFTAAGAHGFDISLPTRGLGSQLVCVTFVNVGAGSNKDLPCITFTGQTTPVGVVESVTPVVGGGIRVQGWAVDPDTTAPLQVNIAVNGSGLPYAANVSRPDVNAALLTTGNHGFDVTIPAQTIGNQHVCVTFVNVGPGSNKEAGCFDVRAMTGSPFGSLDSVSVSPGAVNVSGWAIDPDTSNPIPVRVVVGGLSSSITSNASREDVAAAIPGYGALHGFSGSVSASAGQNQVCVYALETVGMGSDTLLGCRTVTVP